MYFGESIGDIRREAVEPTDSFSAWLWSADNYRAWHFSKGEDKGAYATSSYDDGEYVCFFFCSACMTASSTALALAMMGLVASQ